MTPQIGVLEWLLILVVIIVVVGPKRIRYLWSEICRAILIIRDAIFKPRP